MSDATTTPLEALRALLRGTDVVPLEGAEKILTEVLVDLEEESGAVAQLLGDNATLQARIEAIEARDTPLTVFEEAIQRAHVAAHHRGHWEACPNLVCRSLEEWVMAARKDGTT